MSYANGTTHYNLPQTQGTDKRDWSDTNQAFANVDADLYSAKTDSAQALSNAASAQSTANTANTTANTANTKATAAQTAANSASELAQTAKTTADSASTAANTATSTANTANTTANNAISAIGTLTNLVTTAKNNLVAAINEVATKTNTNTNNLGNLNNLQTETKSNLVAAINEVLSQIGGGGMPQLDYANPIFSFDASHLSTTTIKDCYLFGIIRDGGTIPPNITVDGTQIYIGTEVPGGVNELLLPTPLFIKSGTPISVSAITTSTLKLYEEL